MGRIHGGKARSCQHAQRHGQIRWFITGRVVRSADTGAEQLADLKEGELKRPGDLGDLGRVISLGNGT